MVELSSILHASTLGLADLAGVLSALTLCLPLWVRR
jgi:hypothetical protein